MSSFHPSGTRGRISHTFCSLTLGCVLMWQIGRLQVVFQRVLPRRCICFEYLIKQYPQSHSPDPHFAVHDTGGVEFSQQIFHLVVSLSIFHHVAMVGRNIGLQDIIHQAVEAALLGFTVLLQYPAVGRCLETT